jgi:predicted DNA-binding protein
VFQHHEDLQKIARWTGVDPHAERYELISPYTYAYINPARFIDNKGKDPGDIVIIFSGANIPPLITANRSASDPFMKTITSNSNSATVEQYNTLYYMSDSKATEEAYNDIVAAQTRNPDSKVIIYGYSYGGVLAKYLSKRLDQQHIKVDLLVIVDAANGKKSNKVDRKISNNVKKNKTYYENNDANSAMREFLVGSHGGPSEGSLNGQVENYNLSKETYKNESIDHYNIDDASREREEKAIIDVLRDLKDGENKTISKEEIKKILR